VSQKPYSCDHVVPIEEEPRHHLVLENEFVRGFAVEIAPHDRTLCHHHPNDYLLYVAGGAEILSVARDEKPKRLSYRDGECDLAPGGLVHVVENLSERAFRNIVIELLPGAGSLLRGARPKVVRGECTVRSGFSHERAAVFMIEMEPGAEAELFGPAVVATPYDDGLNPEDAGDVEVKHNVISDLAWIPPGRGAVLWQCRNSPERAIAFQVGITDGAFVAVPKKGEPVRSLRASCHEEDFSPTRNPCL